MMRLDAYALADLQVLAAALRRASGLGMDLHGLAATVDAHVAGRLRGAVAPLQKTPPPPRECPACGRGRLAPVANFEGLAIFGCRACRYSEVIG